jgi:hypothetical protein
MKNKTKTLIARVIVIVLLVATLLEITVASVSAASTSSTDDNLETMTMKDCNSAINEIVTAIINNRSSVIQDNSSKFTSDAYNSINNYMSNNDIKGDGVGDITIEFTYPANSSTGDTVIMVNTKIWYSAQSYNLIYLFEFHVNSYGDIYGFNVWTY